MKLGQEHRWTVTFPDTPLGTLELLFSPRGLAALVLASPKAKVPSPVPSGSPDWARMPEPLAGAVALTLEALTQYFAGKAVSFVRLPLDLRGTPFQLRVWQELRSIPWGETVSYQTLAGRLGSPQAARAVGRACGANPVPIIVPCHRVIAADGSLGGYSSGLAHKRWLLQHEGVALERLRPRKS